MQTRLILYFIALERERHFARAAEACGVSQPTLSGGLNALEKQLGKRLVVRDRRFIELTPEGEALLPWARQMMAAQSAMAAAVATTRGPLQGELRLGVIPAALPLVGRFAAALFGQQPGLTLSSRSLTSREIARALFAYEIDAGLTYLDHEAPTDVLSVSLYAEQYRVLIRKKPRWQGRATISIAEAVELPLCLLNQGMQNRRILDARMAERGFALSPRATADSYVALMAMVEADACATIIPDRYIELLPALPWAHVMDFEEPIGSSRIGLVVSDRTPLAPLASAAMEAAHRVM